MIPNETTRETKSSLDETTEKIVDIYLPPNTTMSHWPGWSFDKGFGEDAPIRSDRNNIFGYGILDSIVIMNELDIGQVG